jgi:MinD-like ATPase involved in chromosome partitioning or flagellar assembly
VSEPTIALVFSPEPWVEQLHRHLADHGGARVRQIVLDPALALEETYDALVVSHRWPGLTARFVQAVHARGSSVLGVFDPDEPAGEAHLLGLGVDRVVAADTPIAAFVHVIAALGSTTATITPAPPAPAPPVGGHGARRAPVVVTGIPGSGASEIALGIATASARRGATVLVDAQEHCPSLATRLGLAIEPGLPAAVEAAEHDLGDLAAMLAPVARHLDVVVGAPGAGAAAQLRAVDVAAVLAELADRGACVVVDVASDHDAPIGRHLVRDAGALVFVAAATPLGVTRTLAWFARTRADLGATPVHVVLNRAPRDRFRRSQLEHEVWRTLGRGSVTFVPTDARIDDAMWRGTIVGRGPFSAAIGRLADAVHADRRSAGAPPVRTRRRPRRAA